MSGQFAYPKNGFIKFAELSIILGVNDTEMNDYLFSGKIQNKLSCIIKVLKCKFIKKINQIIE